MKKIFVLLTLIMSFVWIGCQQPTTIIDEGDSTIEQGGGNGNENGGNESTESPTITVTNSSVTLTYGNTTNSDEFGDFTFELYYSVYLNPQSYSQYNVTVPTHNLTLQTNAGVYNIDHRTNGVVITPQNGNNKKFDSTKTVLNGTTVKLYVYLSETQS